MTCSSYY